MSKIVTPMMLAGRYLHQPRGNDWHEGELKQVDSKRSPSFRWPNKAGATWILTPDLVNTKLLCDKESPYYDKENGNCFILEMKPAFGSEKPTVDGFQFYGTFYKRVGD